MDSSFNPKVVLKKLDLNDILNGVAMDNYNGEMLYG